MGQLAGQVALITGGAKGIGRGIAIALAQAGADVVVSNRGHSDQADGSTAIDSMVAAKEVVEAIQALGQRAIAIEADVTCAQDIEQMVSQTLAQFGRLDILVCSAGVVSRLPIEALTEAEWNRTFDINVKGVFLACQAVIPTMRQQKKGCIITISSIAGKGGAPGLTHYCASKFAVVGFTNALAKELAADTIRVNAICPGIVQTQMWEYLAEEAREGQETKEDAWQRIVETQIPLMRPQTPEDMGQLAVYIAAAPNLTGQAINLDGGIRLY